jgi:hypothetical protein
MNRPPIERLAREEERDTEQSLVMRLGLVVAGGVIAAVASSLPAALRMGEDGSPSQAVEQWVVLSAVATPAAIAAVAILKRARVGLLLLMGERAPLLALGALWWSVIELGLLSIFGAVLRKTTHHHALAGVTFAAFAIASGALVGLFAQRTTAMLARGGLGLQKIGLVVAGGAAFLVVMLVGIRTSRAEGLHTAAALVDGLAFAVTCTIGSSRIVSKFRALAIAGVPVAVLVMMVGLTTLRFDPKLRETLPETAPAHMVIIDIFR